jgi:UDP-N-acetylmuramoyl-tripeptide--D-alanyl-D-alanine ligase
LPNISLSKLALVINGRILTQSHNINIPFSVSRHCTTAPASITFLTKRFKGEQALIDLMKKRHVRCVIIDNSLRLSAGKWQYAGIAIILVPNLNWTYTRLARYYNSLFSIPRIQVVGSSGKTTTKEMIGSVLKVKFHTLVGLGNMNAVPGVGRNIFRLNENHQVAVLEAGMKGPGIITICSRLIMPTFGVITSINSSHLVRMGSIKNTIAAKAEILQFIPKTGSLIVNWDDANCRKLPLHRCKGKIIRYGFSKQCDVWASNIKQHKFTTTFMVHAGKLLFPCSINIIGKYNVGNALAAVAIGLKMGMKPEEIARGLQRFKPVNRRLKVYHTGNKAVIIDDNYNANPDSTRMLIDELIVMARSQPLVLVIGDMEQPFQAIAKYARKVHFMIGKQIAQGNFTHVLAVGLWAREYVRGAIQNGFPKDKITYYRTVRDAENDFMQLLTPGTTVVLKASLYTQLTNLRIKALS